MNPVTYSILELFILALPVAVISWTVTHEEVFRELHEYCVRQSKRRKTLIARKFFYLFTCEYCFSHYVTIVVLIVTHFTLLFPDWRGYLVSGFSLVAVANVYMSIFAIVRVELRKEKASANNIENNSNL